VHKAFTPRSIAKIGERVDELSRELLDKASTQGEVDLKTAFALPIPVTVISEMVGVSDEDMPKFIGGMRVLTSGMTGWNLFRTLWDMRGIADFIRELIAKKKANPQDDILTALIEAREEDGTKLSEDELISMVILLIIAGYETTVHLITNSIITLLQHPDQLALLRENPDLMESAIEEVLRYHGPIEATKPMYTTEDVSLYGVTIPKKSMVMPLLGAANHDERFFENPDVFDITRSPNQHMGFGRGIHYCLGAPLARLETKIALTNLLERYPNLRLAVEPEDLPVQLIPMWHRYERLPVILG
jgi:cytochrome P450